MILLVTVVYFAKRRRGQNRNQNPYYNPSEGSNPTATTGYSNRPERETTAFIVNSEGKETLDGSVETKVIPHILKNYEKFRKKQGMCFKQLQLQEWNNSGDSYNQASTHPYPVHSVPTPTRSGTWFRD